MKFTVITVCFCAENVIEATMKSVLQQTYNNIEYILVDGGSSDATLSIINSIINQREYSESIDIKVISEPDNGLYDAMNKGVKIATGDYIQFLNAGDAFVDEHVLENVAKKASINRKEILFGNVIYSYPNNTKALRKYGKWCAKPIYYLTGDSINHQCIFASKGCFDIHRFDSDSLKICADREWLMQMTKEKIPFVATNVTICSYSLSEDSVSIVNNELQWEEAEWCIRRHYKWGYPIYCVFRMFRGNGILSRCLHYIYEKLFIEGI